MTCIHGYLLCFLFHRRWFIQSSDCRYLSSVLGFQPPREGEEEGQGEGGGRGCSRDIRWDKSYYRGQIAWPVRGNLRRCQNGWPAYEHGNHIRLKPHCLMDAICLNPIIRPQFITAYFSPIDTVCFNNSSSMLLPIVPPFPPYLQPEMSIGERGEGDILHSRSSLQRSRNIFARKNFNITIYPSKVEQEKYFH